MDQFDNIKIVKKALKAREVIFKDGVAFLCGRSTHITVVEIESGTLEISESKIQTKSTLVLDKIIFEHKRYI